MATPASAIPLEGAVSTVSYPEPCTPGKAAEGASASANGAADDVDASPSGGSSSPSPRPTKKSTVDELREGLEELGLDVRGKRDTLFRRLFNAVRRLNVVSPSSTDGPDWTSSMSMGGPSGEASGSTSALGSASISGAGAPSCARSPYKARDLPLTPKAWGKQPYRSFLCFDVEGTCRGGKEFNWPNEIIEFPVVLVRWAEDDVPSNGELRAAGGRGEEVGQGLEGDDAPAPPGAYLSSRSIEKQTLGAETMRLDGGLDQTSPESASTDESLASTTSAEPAVPQRQRPRLRIVDQFHSYVRPVWQPVLSQFCTDFTGITQETVDAAPTFPEVLKKLEAWLDGHGLRDGEGLKEAMWVTDGPWDLRDFQLHITPCDPPYPLYLRQPYLNIKQAFQTVLSEEHRRAAYAATHPGAPPNARALSRITTSKLVGKDGQDRIKGLGFYSTIPGMLAKLGLGPFEGRQHCGLDDATNVARILIALAEKDALFEPNGKLPPTANARKRWPWMGQPGEVHWEDWMSDAKSGPLAVSAKEATVVRDAERDGGEPRPQDSAPAAVTLGPGVAARVVEGSGAGAQLGLSSAEPSVEVRGMEERKGGDVGVDAVSVPGLVDDGTPGVVGVADSDPELVTVCRVRAEGQ